MFVRSYARASTDMQVVSTDQQHAKNQEAFNRRIQSDTNWRGVQWGGEFTDEATSRASIFREREGGSRILAASIAGDIIVVSKFDRLLAGVVDAIETINYVNERKIRLWILDFGGMELDTTTPIGETLIVMMAQLKRLELHDIRSRTSDSLQYRKRAGLPHSNRPVGWEIVNTRVPGYLKPRKYYVIDHVGRRLARQILEIKNTSKYTYDQAAQLCNSMGLKQISGRRWNAMTFRHWCLAAQKNFPLPNGSHTPAPIPADATPINTKTISPDDP